MRIAIPSYRRADTLATKTIPLLLDRGVDPAIIDVFISDPGELPAYRQALQGTGVNLHPGAIGMRDNRSVMARHYPKGENVVAIDDDLTDIIEAVDAKTSRPLQGLTGFFEQAFEHARRNGCTLWGIYPVANPYFMKPKITTGLTYIVGCLYGWVTDPDADWHHTHLDDKEDFERSIRFYERDGAVLRIGWVAPVTRYYKEPGGMQVERTEQRINESVQWLLDNYGQFCTVNTRKSSGPAEVKLRDRRRVD
jgi:hypothetical protein